MVNPEWQRLVEENLDLARSVAWQFARKGLASIDPAVDMDDIQVLAFEGLVRAARRFDPSRGNRFSTYAVPAIRHAIWKAFRGRRQGLRVSPSLRRERLPQVVSLDLPVGEDGDIVLGEVIGATGPGDVEEAVALRDVVTRLPEGMRLVLLLRAQGLTQGEVADCLGMSRTWVNRLESRGRRRLLEAIGN